MAIPNVTRGGLRSARLLAAGTATRIVLTPVVMGLVLIGDGGDDDRRRSRASLFCVAAATDWIDGRLARRWNVDDASSARSWTRPRTSCSCRAC